MIRINRLRPTGNILPLIFLHMLFDYSCLTSGSAGSFTVTAFDIRLHLLISVLNIACAAYILRSVTADRISERLGKSA